MGASAPMEEVAMDQNTRTLKRIEALSAMRRRRNRNLVLGIIGIAGFLFIWEMIVVFEIISPKLIVSPLQVLKTLVAKITDPRPEGSVLLEHISSSLVVALSGYFLAICIGVPLGLLMGWYKPLDKLFGPTLEILRPIPPIAWIPLITMWFGIFELPKVIIIFLGAVVPIVVNAYTGVAMVPELNTNAGKVFGADSRQLLVDIVLPTAFPSIFAGIRTAISSGWVVMLAAEMISAKSGLGFIVTRGQEVNDYPVILLAMMFIGIIGALLSFIANRVERLLCPWMEK